MWRRFPFLPYFAASNDRQSWSICISRHLSDLKPNREIKLSHGSYTNCVMISFPKIIEWTWNLLQFNEGFFWLLKFLNLAFSLQIFLLLATPDFFNDAVAFWSSYFYIYIFGCCPKFLNRKLKFIEFILLLDFFLSFSLFVESFKVFRLHKGVV